MSFNDRIETFLKYQEKNMSFEEICNKMEMKSSTLRRTLNKNGYKSVKGKYVKSSVDDINQMSFEDMTKNKRDKNNKNKEDVAKVKNIKEKTVKTKDKKEKEKISTKNSKKTTPKKDKKINISQEDLDKICEVYDWYIEVKDLKTLKPKKLANKKDIVIEDENISNVKSVNIRVDKETWEEFERLCSNSSYSKKEIVTQAFKDFMKTYKNLL